MAFIPNTVVRLLSNIPLDKDYQNTMNFSNINNQTSYFIGKTKFAFTDFTYQRRTKQITVPVEYDKAFDCNYVMFQNSNFGSKWFYGFITNLEYNNQSSCVIEFEIDVIQTWLFAMQIKQSFVEREHVSDDRVGRHTLNENLEVGELVCNHKYVEGFSGQYYYIMNTTVDPNNGTDITTGGVYNGILSSGKWFAWTNIETFRTKLASIVNQGKEDAIVNIFMLPTDIVETSTNGEVKETYTGKVDEIIHPKLNNLDGYTPKNNKLKCYPYMSVRVSNNNSQFVEMRPERWFSNTTNILFKMRTAVNSNCVMSLTPQDYNGVDNDFRYTVELPPFPTCQWINDPYATWLNQNGTSNLSGFIGSVVAGGGLGAVMGGGVGSVPGAIVGGASYLLGLMGKAIDMDKAPMSAQGSGSTNTINSSLQLNTFKIEMMTLKNEIAQTIDDFFEVYGYKVTELKTPNITSRRYWNYIKTVGANIMGNIPKDDLEKIRSIFDHGTTFWHDDDIGNYNRTNSII